MVFHLFHTGNLACEAPVVSNASSTNIIKEPLHSIGNIHQTNVAQASTSRIHEAALPNHPKPVVTETRSLQNKLVITAKHGKTNIIPASKVKKISMSASKVPVLEQTEPISHQSTTNVPMDGNRGRSSPPVEPLLNIQANKKNLPNRIAPRPQTLDDHTIG